MKIYAHRGASCYAPENTMAAFELAKEMGADGIELDVQLTADGEVVVIHDETLERVSDGKGRVNQHTLKALRALDFGEWFSPQYTRECIPTLSEVLDLLRNTDMDLNIEIKAAPAAYDPQLTAKTVRLIQSSCMMDRIIVSSFDHRCLADVRELDPRIPLGLLYDGNLRNPGAYAHELHASYIHPNHAFLDSLAMNSCVNHGIGVNVWTVDDAQVARAMKAMGVRALITNRPNVLSEQKIPMSCTR